ncbi:MAG: hypothetical protein ACPGUV_12800 [Polyangiales bacterium]
MQHTVERRQRRSDNPNGALVFQLENVRDRGGMRALVLADADGLLVAAAGEHALAEEIGALAPLIARATDAGITRHHEELEPVAVRPVQLLGQQLYLAGVGGGLARDALMRHAGEGVQRIVEAN